MAGSTRRRSALRPSMTGGPAVRQWTAPTTLRRCSSLLWVGTGNYSGSGLRNYSGSGLPANCSGSGQAGDSPGRRTIYRCTGAGSSNSPGIIAFTLLGSLSAVTRTRTAPLLRATNATLHRHDALIGPAMETKQGWSEASAAVPASERVRASAASVPRTSMSGLRRRRVKLETIAPRRAHRRCRTPAPCASVRPP